MNKISAYTKVGNSKLYTQEIDGKITFTFANSALFDERLDEAYLYIEQSSIPSIEPTTEISVLVKEENNSQIFYYIISSDRSQEQPNGSGKYKHEIHLLERTKLLEGIYCSSLTFTNSKGNIYTNKKSSALTGLDFGSTSPTTQKAIDYFANKISTPLVSNEDLLLPSCSSMIFGLQQADPESYLDSETTIGTSSTITVISNNDRTVYNSFESPIINSDSVVSVEYELSWGVMNEDVYGVKVSYIISFVQNQYPLKPWTITDCVNRCLQLAEPIFEGETPRYTFAPSQATKYNTVYAPEFTMTQCTLREQLKVIGSFIHAEPRLGGYDENGVYQENMIFFDEYGAGGEASIADKPYIYKAFSHDINEYCTHIDTSASNLVNALDYAEGVVTEPNINNYRTLRTESINVMLSESNSYAKTDNPIYDIPNQENGVLVTLYNADGSAVFEDVDITPYIFTETEYNNLSSFSGGYPYTKHYALYYTKGREGIRGLFYKVENAFNEIFSNYAIVNILKAVTGVNYKNEISEGFTRLAFKITYVPIYDTKFSHSKQTVKLGKKPFSRIYNQSENLIESRYYGENVKGVAQRMGNVEQTRTYILWSLNDIPKVGETIDGYFIVDVKTEIQHSFIKCTVQLSKDFNRISQYVGISSNKRVYEVSEQETYARDILLKNYVVVGDNTDNITPSNSGAILGTVTPIMQIFNPNISGKINAPLNAVTSYSLSKTGNGKLGNVILPVISSAFGNAMVFSWDYKDNYSAGEKASADSYDIDDKGTKATATWQRDIAYGNYYGRAWWYCFELYSNIDMVSSSGESSSGESYEYRQSQTVENLIPQEENDSSIKTPGALLLRKDSRERLSFNYEIEFVTTHDDIIIGSALASSCPLVTTRRNAPPPIVYFYKGTIGKFDRKPNAQLVTQANISVINNTIVIPIPQPTEAFPDVDFDSWAIVSPISTKSYKFENEYGEVESGQMIEGGEILLARNKSKAQYGNATTETIKFQIANTIFDR